MNNSLNQIGKQLLAIWKQLGLNQKVSLVLAAAVVVAGLAGLTVWSSRPDYALLYGRLPESESAKVISALEEMKIPYRITGSSVMVPAEKVHTARAQLATKGVPRSNGGAGFELLDQPNFGISDLIQRANLTRAVQGELARTICEFDSIDSSRVMVTMPENRLLADQQKKPTASVFVHVRGSSALPAQTVTAIQLVVANSIEGLQANSVSVVDNLGNVLSQNLDNDSVGGMSTGQLAARQKTEAYLAKKVEDMLSVVLGSGQSVARVAIELNLDSTTRTEEKYDPDGAVAKITTVNDENTETTSSSPGAGGVPGVSTNSSPDTNMVASVPMNSTKTKKKVTNNQYEINRTTSSVTMIPGGIRRISAAVFVAAKTESTNGTRKVIARTPEELEKLRRIVKDALGIVENDPLRKDQVSLEEMPFNDQPALEITRQFEKQEKTEFWMRIAGKAIYPAAAAMMLLFFWRTFKKTSNDGIPLGVPLGELSPDGQGNGNGKSAPPVVTVEVLNQLIRENPNNMSQAIRSWMSRGKSTN
jgi:flagellar M-ring protein FliF